MILRVTFSPCPFSLPSHFCRPPQVLHWNVLNAIILLPRTHRGSLLPLTSLHTSPVRPLFLCSAVARDINEGKQSRLWLPACSVKVYFSMHQPARHFSLRMVMGVQVNPPKLCCCLWLTAKRCGITPAQKCTYHVAHQTPSYVANSCLVKRRDRNDFQSYEFFRGEKLLHWNVSQLRNKYQTMNYFTCRFLGFGHFPCSDYGVCIPQSHIYFKICFRKLTGLVFRSREKFLAFSGYSLFSKNAISIEG